jgi:hypothetical protein
VRKNTHMMNRATLSGYFMYPEIVSKEQQKSKSQQELEGPQGSAELPGRMESWSWLCMPDLYHSWGTLEIQPVLYALGSTVHWMEAYPVSGGDVEQR